MGSGGNLMGVIDSLVRDFRSRIRTPATSSVRDLCLAQISKARIAAAANQISAAEREIQEIRITLEHLPPPKS